MKRAFQKIRDKLRWSWIGLFADRALQWLRWSRAGRIVRQTLARIRLSEAWRIANRLGGLFPRNRLLRWALGGFGAVAALFAGIIVWYAHDLPDIEQLRAPARRPSVTVTAADGSIVATYGALFAGPVRLDDLPPYLTQAIIATEDHRFFDHFGVDPTAVLRAAWVNLRSGAVRQGGSTITQQLAKNLFLSPDRTLRRKVQELVLALWLEVNFTKRELFSIYVNRLYLGAGTYGVEAAARRYFGVSATDISVREAAVLAGLIKAPSRYAPTHNLEGALERADVVLDRMVAEEYLSPEQARAAAATPLRRVGGGVAGSGRYFADWVMQRAAGYVAQVPNNLVIQTTLDPKYQAAGERRLTSALDKMGASRNVGQGALLALAPDGAVRAMVGGRDYRKSQFNRTTQALRQPGSAFKLFVYLAALEAGFSPGDEMTDRPVQVGKWRPRNYAGKYKGSVTLREAFASSINSVAVQVTEKMGRDRVIETARRLGIVSPLRPHPSIALGASEVTLLELTTAYATVANGGRGVWPYAILEIRDTTGKVYFRHTGAATEKVIEPEHVDAMRDMLATVIAEGTGRAAALDRPMGGKTGTSQDFRDAWFVGYTPDLIAGVWVGNDNASPMMGVAGGGLPARIWKGFVAETSAGKSPGWERVAPRSFFSRLAGAFGGLFGSSEPAKIRNAAPAARATERAEPAPLPMASSKPRRASAASARRPSYSDGDAVDPGDYLP